MSTLKLTISSLCAGIAIAMGGIAFLITGNAWVFPIGLLMVCFFQLHLFTGRIAYASVYDIPRLIWMWIMNTIGATGMGILMHFYRPEFIEKAQTITANKLAINIWIIPSAILCNILIFTAVHAWKNLPSPNNIITLIFATAMFVACGFDHCIANAFYFGYAGMFDLSVICFICLNMIGNAIGGLIAYHAIQFIKEG